MEVRPFDYKNYNKSIDIEIQPLRNYILKIEEPIPAFYADNKYQLAIQGNTAFLRSAKRYLPIRYCQDAVGAIFRQDNNLETVTLCDGVTCTVAPAQTAPPIPATYSSQQPAHRRRGTSAAPCCQPGP
jgi:hypothetical protein